jgi:hypothetical protein
MISLKCDFYFNSFVAVFFILEEKLFLFFECHFSFCHDAMRKVAEKHKVRKIFEREKFFSENEIFVLVCVTRKC